MAGTGPEIAGFHADIDGFSGPFDLLCSLVESRELEAARISVGQVVRIYGAYLANTGKVPVSVVSEFLVLAASLVLNKVVSLLPGRESAGGETAEEVPGEVLEKLARYRPYRAAARHLLVLKERQDRFFCRIVPEDGEASYDLGDLFSLCRLWWNLIGERKSSPGNKALFPDGEREWDGIPSALPEEEQIGRKIEEIRGLLERGAGERLSCLLRKNRSVSMFVVTLLALLEMSRAGLVRIIQEELFGDVVILRC